MVPNKVPYPDISHAPLSTFQSKELGITGGGEETETKINYESLDTRTMNSIELVKLEEQVSF